MFVNVSFHCPMPITLCDGWWELYAVHMYMCTYTSVCTKHVCIRILNLCEFCICVYSRDLQCTHILRIVPYTYMHTLDWDCYVLSCSYNSIQ